MLLSSLSAPVPPSARQRPGWPVPADGSSSRWPTCRHVRPRATAAPHPLVFMGSLDGARRALDWIAAFEPNWVVPGRGPVVSAQQLSGVLEAHRRYYRLVVDTAQAGPRDGLSPLEAAVGCDLGPFSALPIAFWVTGGSTSSGPSPMPWPATTAPCHECLAGRDRLSQMLARQPSL
jgi:hypothetical protein